LNDTDRHAATDGTWPPFVSGSPTAQPRTPLADSAHGWPLPPGPYPPTSAPGMFQPAGAESNPASGSPFETAWPPPSQAAPQQLAARRSVGAPAAVSVLVCLPALITSALIVWLIGSIGGSTIALIGLLGWLASGALAFVGTAEEILAASLLRLRRPTAHEAAMFAPAWARVCFRAGVDPLPFTLWIEDSDEVNASATGGHIVAMTPRALSMPPASAEALLAHELGHHLKGHASVALLTSWYALPGRAAIRVIRAVLATITRVGIGLLSGGFLVGIAFVFVAGFIAIAVAPYAIPILAMPYLQAASQRFEELQADDVALRLGYGGELRTILDQDLESGVGARQQHENIQSRLLATHPSVSRRIARLDKRMAVSTGLHLT